MRKLHIVGLALFAAFVFSALAASAAFAETPLWLISGADVLTLTSVDTEGEILLENSKVSLLGGAKADVLCSFLLEGSVGPEGEDEITAVFSLTGTETRLGGTALTCTNDENCETPLVFPENLPWLTQLELMGAGIEEFLDKLFTSAGGLPGWAVECNTIIGKITDECTLESSVALENMAGESDVLALFDTVNGLSQKASCTQGNATSGEIVAELLITALEGLTLAVSEP